MIGIPLLLRAEWLALAIIGVAGYVWMGGALLWLLPLLLAPDISAIGYLAGPRIGAMTYNAVHNLVLAFGLFGIGWLVGPAPLALAGAILAAHVGMDRALGYGLKLRTRIRRHPPGAHRPLARATPGSWVRRANSAVRRRNIACLLASWPRSTDRVRGRTLAPFFAAWNHLRGSTHVLPCPRVPGRGAVRRRHAHDRGRRAHALRDTAWLRRDS